MSAPAFGTLGTPINTPSATPQFPVPAGVANLDIIVIPFFIDGSAVTVTAMPAGFAHAENSPRTVNGVGGGNHSLNVVWKRANAGDTGNYNFTISVSAVVQGAAMNYTGCVTTGNPWDSPSATGDGGNTNSTTTPAVAVNTLGPDRMLFFAGSNWGGGAWTPPTGMTERLDAGTNITAADLVQAVLGGSGSLQATCASSDKTGSWLGALIGTTVAGPGDPFTLYMPDFMFANFPAYMQTFRAPRFPQPNDETGVAGPQAYTSTLTATIGFTANDTALTSKTQTATVGFTGSLKLLTARLLAATLSFTGADAVRISKVQLATLGFTGSLSRLTTRALAAMLGFTGVLLRSTLRPLVASLAFTGTLLAGHRFTQALNAALSFTSGVTTRTSKTQGATLNFTGALPRLTRDTETATVGFTGSLIRTIGAHLVGVLSFIGAVTRRVGHTLTATVSFAGTVTTQAVHFFTQALSASLSFTGTQTRSVAKTVAATVGFTGALVRRASRVLAATVGFTGAQTRRVASLGVATLAFAGALMRRTSKGLAATFGASGALTTQVAHFFTKALSATVGFTGTLTIVRIFIKLLTATVGMTGTLTRRTGRSLAASLTFVGTHTRRIGTRLVATLTFVAVWTRVPTLFSALSDLRDRIFGRESGGVSGRRGSSNVSYERDDGPIDGREDGT